MTEDTNRPDEAPQFETDTVQADRAREQGLGMGERELNAQRDPGGVSTANEDQEQQPQMEADQDEIVDEDTAVQGDDQEQQPEAPQA